LRRFAFFSTPCALDFFQRVLESGWLYLGRPAKAVRPLTREELDYFAYLADGYARLARDYREGVNSAP